MKLIHKEVLHSAASLALPAKEASGVLKRFTHWSNVMKRDMRFSFFSPDEEDFYPLVYALPAPNSVSTDELHAQAFKHRLSMVIPEIAPENDCTDLDCTGHQQQVNRLYDYVSEELDYLISEN
jgi:hypothetical protein